MTAGYRIDLHVHTGRYSQCAEAVDPYRVAEYALRTGLAGVLITEHDLLWQDEELELLRAASPQVRIYRGIEVSSRGCHLVVTGITEAATLHRGATVEEVVDLVSRERGAVILAHPYRDGGPEGLPVHLVDAIEVASTSSSLAESVRAWALAEHFAKPSVAASDAHALSMIGWAWTELPFLPADESELAAAIREGLGTPTAPHIGPFTAVPEEAR